MLKNIVDYEHNVDWSGRRETPAGAAGQVRPRRRAIRRGGSPPAPRTARAWNGNQHSPLTQPIKKNERREVASKKRSNTT
ncbi:hypothetical protein AA980_10500 [Neobacillus vireti]|nr:hypothetical protein AA980_10500 [Neobacillus vireti]